MRFCDDWWSVLTTLHFGQRAEVRDQTITVFKTYLRSKHGWQKAMAETRLYHLFTGALCVHARAERATLKSQLGLLYGVRLVLGSALMLAANVCIVCDSRLGPEHVAVSEMPCYWENLHVEERNQVQHGTHIRFCRVAACASQSSARNA